VRRRDCVRPASEGQTLIGLLAVIVIISIMAVVFLKPGGDGRNKGKSMPTQVKERAQGVECKNNLNQLRQAIMMMTQTDEAKPKSLREISGIPESMFSCPVGGQPYQYDPSTGQVRCVCPGHERY